MKSPRRRDAPINDHVDLEVADIRQRLAAYRRERTAPPSGRRWRPRPPSWWPRTLTHRILQSFAHAIGTRLPN